ncbi:MAG: helix-turn-helix transcriptional regulator, partial [Pseudarthrobacter sp.]|nr:helix-turn-helix transcriptional regulator [Pseudarthrobacter sp.]
MNLGPDTAKGLRPARTTATRQKLFDASMELIGERGAASVTVDEIAAAAGVSKGTVYYNFGSKSELIAQLLRHGVDIL